MLSGIMVNSPSRTIKAKVELYSGSTLLTTYSYTDALIDLEIERVGNNKFFGFGICQKAKIKLRDITREIDITTANSFKVYFGSDVADYVSAFPTFFVTEVSRDENTGAITVTAHDAIYRAAAINMKDALAALGFGNSYNVTEFIIVAADAIGAKGIALENVDDLTPFQLQYDSGANFDGSEKARECLDAVAEITQTIYFINYEDKIIFKRLAAAENPLEISKADYFTLESKTDKKLVGITHATELGDNISATTGEEGLTQYVRNNPFWELRDDAGALVENALAAMAGFTIHQFNLKWRGNYLLEIGDAVTFQLKNDEYAVSYLIDDTIKYNGGLSQVTKWEYADNSTETATNPTTLGEALKATYARVDKANKEITLLASETKGNSEAISTLQVNTESITASVSRISEIEEEITSANEDISTLKQEVSAKISADEATLIFTNEIANGVDKVETSTGFTFDEDGLTVSKSGSELSTQITEDGMTIYKNNEEVLVADNGGVQATDLHATTYLIIGTYSRIEDYMPEGTNNTRTGCFWLGG